jgi:phage I-like protein
MANKSTKTKQQIGVGVAACSLSLNEAGELQLTPAGSFRGIDGRPAEVPAWNIDSAIAANVIAFNSSRNIDLVIDYEHQTLHKEKNGQPAPAAGWFSGAGLVFREGEGLFARAELTQRAKDYIAAGEYKYLSPVFFYDKKTGNVLGIHSAALTNTPNIDGMAEVAIAAASADLAQLTNPQETTMDIEDLLEQLRWLFNLPTLATKEEVMAELQKAVNAIKQSNPTETAAASFSITGLVTGLNAQVAALSAATPDPAKYAPVETMQALQSELADLKKANLQRDVDGVVVAAMSQGKLLPAQEKWARDLGMSNLAALNQYLETAQPIDALTGTQTGGNPPEVKPQGELSEAQLAMCTATGVSPDEFKKTLAAQAAS